METIEDHEIGPRWAEHYPKRKSHILSKALVITLCKILQNKARHGIGYGDWSDKVHHVLIEFGIPKQEFEEVEKLIEPPD
jgi:hypothetical protein